MVKLRLSVNPGPSDIFYLGKNSGGWAREVSVDGQK